MCCCIVGCVVVVVGCCLVVGCCVHHRTYTMYLVLASLTKFAVCTYLVLALLLHCRYSVKSRLSIDYIILFNKKTCTLVSATTNIFLFGFRSVHFLNHLKSAVRQQFLFILSSLSEPSYSVCVPKQKLGTYSSYTFHVHADPHYLLMVRFLGYSDDPKILLLGHLKNDFLCT